MKWRWLAAPELPQFCKFLIHPREEKKYTYTIHQGDRCERITLHFKWNFSRFTRWDRKGSRGSVWNWISGIFQIENSVDLFDRYLVVASSFFNLEILKEWVAKSLPFFLPILRIYVSPILKSLQNKKDFNDFTAAPFFVSFFSVASNQKSHRKRGSCEVIKVLPIWWRL